jgi:hypothetical protein
MPAEGRDLQKGLQLVCKIDLGQAVGNALLRQDEPDVMGKRAQGHAEELEVAYDGVL